MVKSMPGAAGTLADQYPDIWKAYAELGKAAAEAEPLTDRERRLVKLALAIGIGSEGAVHSHTRRAKAEGIAQEDLLHIAMLSIGPLGLPRAVAAKTWIEDI
ncbi:MAG: carboxymuconolactone decarboxylase family protein [Thalassospira sp.]|uniref:carboxymuconolactone decarboxylase family protein n=1 Tax=Thalassospira sp. TaxID=1912094 RepID=UPI001B24B05E|nr:carboxymuconolactone decarboxylase family protein [Thalassospira sp.]MBO6580897.1 carboxymuconolactone decarboxylase family protein [Thalassospira sp.]MBO6817112.1 carboxymuconolactone decarboxylase family protein [Thalassospira sp.]MBO6888324.1 carboxymuconolactone decarboxylase family protein [Thalassospira sp.]